MRWCPVCRLWYDTDSDGCPIHDDPGNGGNGGIAV